MTAVLASANKKTKIRPGTLVMVCYPMGETTNNPARKFDGQELVIKSVSHLPKHGGLNRKMFTLFGAESDMGVPYWFLEDELIVL